MESEADKEGSMKMKKRIPMFVAMALLAVMIVLNVCVKEPEEKAEEEKPLTVTISAEDVGQPEQVPGQMEMELTTKTAEEPDRIVKLMRFQAHEVDQILKRISECFDLLILKTDKLNDTMSMILRAIRRE